MGTDLNHPPDIAAARINQVPDPSLIGPDLDALAGFFPVCRLGRLRALVRVHG